MTSAPFPPLRRRRPDDPPRDAPVWHAMADGRAIDLMDPAIGAIDFRQIAEALGQVRRFAGNAMRPVSVAYHLIVCVEIARRSADPAIRAAAPWIGLHDAHEAFVGDLPAPAQRALALLSADFPAAWASLTGRLDLAIWEAAGLGPPNAAERAAIAEVDAMALALERAHHLAPARFEWGAPTLAQPLERLSIVPWRADPIAASDLYRIWADKTHPAALPALTRK